MSRRENKKVGQNQPKNMDRTMQELQHIGSIKDLRPKNSTLLYVKGKPVKNASSGGGGGGGILELIFVGYVPLASQSPYFQL